MMPLPSYDTSNPSAYIASRLALVGDRDPVELLEAAPGRLAEAVAGLSEEGARQPEGDGKWSVLQVLRHLADSEVVYGYRLRLIVASDRPDIPGYDQETWSDRLHYHRGTVAEAVEDVAAGRRMTVRFLRSLDDAEWDRVGVHNERGEESVRRIATLLAGHDIGHEGQIARIRQTASL